MATNPLIYDPRYHTFESWASLMVEHYAEQQLEIPNDKTDWVDWATGLIAIGFFNSQAVPMPQEFSDWDQWASAVLASVNPGVAA